VRVRQARAPNVGHHCLAELYVHHPASFPSGSGKGKPPTGHRQPDARPGARTSACRGRPGNVVPRDRVLHGMPTWPWPAARIPAVTARNNDNPDSSRNGKRSARQWPLLIRADSCADLYHT
jgi:hypothetical protein